MHYPVYTCIYTIYTTIPCIHLISKVPPGVSDEDREPPELIFGRLQHLRVVGGLGQPLEVGPVVARLHPASYKRPFLPAYMAYRSCADLELSCSASKKLS